MTYHSDDGRFFLGCRRTARGDFEIVFDEVGGLREVFHVSASQASEAQIRAAMREALRQRNVKAALYSELSARQIEIDSVP